MIWKFIDYSLSLNLQIRGSLLSIQTLSKMLRVHTSRSEVCASTTWNILADLPFDTSEIYFFLS